MTAAASRATKASSVRRLPTVILGLGSAPVTCWPAWPPDVPVDRRRAGGRALRSACRRPPTGSSARARRSTVDDLDGGVGRAASASSSWSSGPASCGTGTCQGSVCVPHLRAFIADRSGSRSEPFTARPAARQITLGEAAADVHIDAFRRTALHDEHLALGARLDRFGGWWRPWNYGDHVARVLGGARGRLARRRVARWASWSCPGPTWSSCSSACTRPRRRHQARAARAYVLLLNERGHLIDDGMICRERRHALRR